MRVVYLHGFASSPSSSKARFFKRQFAEAGVQTDVPQLDSGNFRLLTITGQLAVVDRSVQEAMEQSIPGEPLVLMGSSLGGYLAALYAARHREIHRVILLAPAFHFPSRFLARFTQEELDHWKHHGSISIFHYGFGEERPLSYQIVEDAAQYEDEPSFSQPALILHGHHDSVVPAELSEKYARNHPNVRLRLLDSGHELTGVLHPMWKEVKDFLALV
jgi:pimeloyl-ACP methyl ester carboxylesterase